MSLGDYEMYLLNSNRKSSTVRGYLERTAFILKECPEFTANNFRDYLLSLHRQGKRNQYLNALLKAARVYSEYKCLPGFREIKFLKPQVFNKATLSDDEIEKLISLPPPDYYHLDTKYDPYHLNGHYTRYDKFSIFLMVMSYSGMRTAEVARLSVSQVDFGRQVFVLDETKTGVPRIVPIAPNIVEPLRRYIANLDGKYLFATTCPTKKRQEPFMSRESWNKAFHNRIDRLGIKREHLTCYSLRHSFICSLLTYGGDNSLFDVMAIVGHKNVSTTMGYHHLNYTNLANLIKKLPAVRKMCSPTELLKLFIVAVRQFDFGNDERFHYEINESENEVTIKIKVK